MTIWKIKLAIWDIWMANFIIAKAILCPFVHDGNHCYIVAAHIDA